jgi:steroid delta-isomerase-like uncharacterized protein
LKCQRKKIASLSIGFLRNSGNAMGGVLDQWFAENYVNHELSKAPVQGRGEYKKWAVEVRNAWMKGFPDYFIAIDDLIAQGDKGAKRSTLRGTHQGEFFGIPATGKQVTTRAVTICCLANGKVQEIFWNYDALGLMQQLGPT